MGGISVDQAVEPKRSALMAKVKSKNTKPELIVRQAAYSLGFRYRLHRKELPGSPDVVFIGQKKAIFVHGCFWHRHKDCRLTSMPKTRVDFWQAKFEANTERDARNLVDLRQKGWTVLTIWECETRSPEKLNQLLTSFLA